MNTEKSLEDDIIEDYEFWLETAIGKKDEIGIKSVSLGNFIIKIENLIKEAQKEEYSRKNVIFAEQ